MTGNAAGVIFVVHLYDSKEDMRPVCAEITKDFGEKVMAMGGFP